MQSVGISGGGLENNNKCYKRDNDFLSQWYVKIILLSSQNESALNNATAGICMIFLMIDFTCRPMYLTPKLTIVRSYFRN